MYIKKQKSMWVYLHFYTCYYNMSMDAQMKHIRNILCSVIILNFIFIYFICLFTFNC